jgi:hypothetical protein
MDAERKRVADALTAARNDLLGQWPYEFDGCTRCDAFRAALTLFEFAVRKDEVAELMARSEASPT